MKNTATNFRNAFGRFAAGEICLFGSVKIPEHLAGSFRAEQISSIARLTPAMMVGNVCNAIVGLIAIWPSPYRWYGLLWAVILISLSTRLLLKSLRSAGRPKPVSVSLRAIKHAVRNSFALGLLWAALPLIFYVDNTRSAQIVIACLSAGMLCTGAYTLSAIPPAVGAFLAPLAISSSVALVRAAEANSMLIVILMAAFALTLLRAVCSHHNDIARNIVEQAAAYESARKDPLTGLLNRKGFEEYIAAKAIEPMKRHGAGFAVMYLDLDHFKTVNDTFGHAAGDELLQRVAERLIAVTRPEDCVARLGGDEFGVICRDVASPAVAAGIAGRILHSFAAPVFVNGRPLACNTSIGIALAPDNGEDAANIIKNADIALYNAKRRKRGDYAFFESATDERAQKRKQIGMALREALAKKELFLEFQPIYATHDRQVNGFEALVRWTHPQLGDVGPAQFIPIAEELGLIQDIGEFIIEEACAALAQWPERMRVSVNFSPLQMRSPALLEVILAALARHGLKPERFEIEVTETVSLEGDTKALAMLEALSAHGMSIALDDFGTGYSSLSYLCTLPVSRVKIDRSFVASIFRTTQSLAVIQAILGLAHSLGMQVVAEGIESRAQFDIVAGHGCEEIQGFLFSKPLSLQAAVQLANNSNSKLRLVA